MNSYEAVTLRDYIDRRIADLDAKYQLQFAGQQDALKLARDELERRLEALNELRSEVTSDRSRFVTQERWEVEHNANIQRITRLERSQARMAGVAITASITLSIVVGLIVRLTA